MHLAYRDQKKSSWQKVSKLPHYAAFAVPPLAVVFKKCVYIWTRFKNENSEENWRSVLLDLIRQWRSPKENAATEPQAMERIRTPLQQQLQKYRWRENCLKLLKDREWKYELSSFCQWPFAHRVNVTFCKHSETDPLSFKHQSTAFKAIFYILWNISALWIIRALTSEDSNRKPIKTPCILKRSCDKKPQLHLESKKSESVFKTFTQHLLKRSDTHEHSRMIMMKTCFVFPCLLQNPFWSLSSQPPLKYSLNYASTQLSPHP